MSDDRLEVEPYEPPRIEARAEIALPLIGRSAAVCMASRPTAPVGRLRPRLTPTLGVSAVELRREILEVVGGEVDVRIGDDIALGRGAPRRRSAGRSACAAARSALCAATINTSAGARSSIRHDARYASGSGL